MFFLVEEDAQDWTEFYKVLSEKRRSHSEDILQAAKNKLQEMAKNRGKVSLPSDEPSSTGPSSVAATEQERKLMNMWGRPDVRNNRRSRSALS